jgi:toxin HigB-1
VPAAVATKLRKIVGFLQSMEQEDELRSLPVWNAHQMTGDRVGTWTLSVTRNWRLTFLIDKREIEIIDVDYEDYH